MSSPTSERQNSDESFLHLRDSGSISSYLTLPRINQSERPRLFKAPASDDKSLTMKKRHHDSHDHSICQNSRRSSVAQNGATACFELRRCQSLPSLPYRRQFSHRNTTSASTRKASMMRDSDPYSRRWTLPMKAASTREISTHSPGDKYRHNRRSGSPRNSPAVITLRRATTSFSQGTSITFFPPPKLNNSKTSLMSHFLNTIVGGNREQEQCDKLDTAESKRRFSIFSQPPPHKAIPATSGEVANPTITKVIFEPTISVTDVEVVPYRSRRCSTKYVTRSSIYEIIWDENDTPTDESELSTPPDMSDVDARRPSIAAMYLEAQLYKSVVQSRRASHALMLGDERGFGAYQGRRLSFQSLLNTSLSRLINESALQRLPRSRVSGGRSGQEIMTSPKDNMHQNTPTRKASLRHNRLEVFPPVQLPTHEAHSSLRAAESHKGPEVNSSYSKDDKICRTGQAKEIRERTGTNGMVMGGITSLGGPKAAVSPMRKRRNNETAPLLDIHIWETHHPW